MSDIQTKTDTAQTAKPMQNNSTGQRTLVLGLGNILLKDEGIGAHVAQKLQKMTLPDNVEVIDGGTASLDVLLLHQGINKLVVIDAIKAGKKPGTIYKTRLKAEQKEKLTQILTQQRSKISLHQIGLIETLAAAEKINLAPAQITIIGVEPEQISYGLELTEQIKQKVPKIINTVLEEIKDVIHTR